ncbi:hypothetical protein FACS1894198_3010 [Clostridia bacterium]|nr:hypothetical protein FACS1894198_3010 [Clostridia bacterium]
MDRLLKHEKEKIRFRGISTTKSGTLLKRDIPIRLGTEWDDARVGFVEIDLVAHCGETTAGEYVNTLDVTDVCTGWTETAAVINKAQKHVFKALLDIRERLPFPLLGIDSDNGRNSSITNFSAIVAKKTFVLRGAARTKRMTVAMLSKRTGLSYAET